MFLPPIPLALGAVGLAGLGYWWWHQHQLAAAQQTSPQLPPPPPPSSGDGTTSYQGSNVGDPTAYGSSSSGNSTGDPAAGAAAAAADSGSSYGAGYGASGGSSSGAPDQGTPWYDPTGWFSAAQNYGQSMTSGQPELSGHLTNRFGDGIEMSGAGDGNEISGQTAGFHPVHLAYGSMSTSALATKAALAAMGSYS